MSAMLIEREEEGERSEICRDPGDPNFRGFVTGCYWEPREPNEGLWFETDGYILPMLDRYAIIPIEKYNALVALKESIEQPQSGGISYYDAQILMGRRPVGREDLPEGKETI